MLDGDEGSLEVCTSKISKKKNSVKNFKYKDCWPYMSANVGLPTTIALIFCRTVSLHQHIWPRLE